MPVFTLEASKRKFYEIAVVGREKSKVEAELKSRGFKEEKFFDGPAYSFTTRPSTILYYNPFWHYWHFKSTGYGSIEYDNNDVVIDVTDL